MVLPVFILPFARRHLGLPQQCDTLGLPVIDAYGKATFRCLIEHVQPTLLDSRGDHAITCKNSKTVRTCGHNKLRVRVGKAAGLQGRATTPSIAQRVAEQKAVQVLLDSAPMGYGLRLDSELIAPDGSDLWFDATMFHTTSAVRREGQLKWHMERAEKESNAAAAGLTLPDTDKKVMHLPCRRQSKQNTISTILLCTQHSQALPVG
jgi:hypothetical protein